MQSIRVLLAEIVDYAGLFAPAQLDMESSTRNYAEYRSGAHSWMLGRFILPATRLDEFAAAAEPFLDEAIPWKLSAICKLPLDDDLRRIERFFGRGLAAQVDAVETLAAHPEEIQHAAQQLAGRFIPYFEVPLSVDLSELIHAISESGVRAKVRTGGITPESIPDSHSIARLIVSCASKKVAFKATAGLHHPVRGLHRLTPDESSPRAPMHGFLNVFLAAALADAGAGLSEIVELLDEDSTAVIAFDRDRIRWRNHLLRTELLAHSRQTLAVSFGSCSFEEPVEDLKVLSLL